MGLFPEEQGGGRRGNSKAPADILARSGLPVPELRSSSDSDVAGFNADFRRLVARISKLISILSPTVQGQTEDQGTTILAPHAPQHENGGSDPINVTGLAGVLAQPQIPQVHDIQGATHFAAGLVSGHVMRASGPAAFSFAPLQDADIPASITRDSELAPLSTRTIGLTIDGTPSTGLKGFVRVPFAGSITRWTLMADVAGAIVFDIWRDTFGAFPPIAGDSIIGAGNKPTLAAQQAADAIPAGWTSVVLVAGDVIAFNVDSAGGLGRVTLQLDVQI